MDTKVQKKVFYNKFSPSSVSYSTYLPPLMSRHVVWQKFTAFKQTDSPGMAACNNFACVWKSVGYTCNPSRSKYLASYTRDALETLVGLLLLADFNQNWNASKHVNESPERQVS
jgi:hypothetical protein